MSEARSLYFSLSHAADGLFFQDFEEFTNFVGELKASYYWLENSDVRLNSNTSSLSKAFSDNIVNIFNVIRDSPDDLTELTLLVQRTLFDGRFPLPKAEVFNFIQSVQKDYGPVIAATILSITVDRMNNYNDLESISALVLLNNFKEGVTRRRSWAVAGSLRKYDARFKTLLRTMTSDALRARQSSKISRAKENEKLKKIRQIAVRQMRASSQTRRKEMHAVLEELRKTKEVYQNFMSLKAPVEYWRTKSTSHQAEAQKYKKIIITYGKWGTSLLVAFLLIIAIISIIVWKMTNEISFNFLFLSIAVLITTVAFWFARIVVKMYLSEHHLSVDAEERAVMITTYLALIEKGSLTAGEKTLILTPLFRPSSDGLIKDDAPADISLGSVLSKYLNK